jgi:hypothetical protein
VSTTERPREATVQTLAAEVRVLMVGSRQVTLSVYRQLDTVPEDEITPFGRVRDSKDEPATAVYVVGAHVDTGALVRSYRHRPRPARMVQDAPLDDWYKIVPSAEAKDEDGQLRPGVRKIAGESNGYCGYGVIAREGDDWVFWRIPRAGYGCTYNYWRYPDEDTAAKAQHLAAINLANLRTTRADYTEWSALPLIVLAGLR